MYQYIKNLISKGHESIISEIFYVLDKEITLLIKNNQDNKSNENNLGEMYLSNSIKNNELTNLNQTFGLLSLLRF